MQLVNIPHLSLHNSLAEFMVLNARRLRATPEAAALLKCETDQPNYTPRESLTLLHKDHINPYLFQDLDRYYLQEYRNPRNLEPQSVRSEMSAGYAADPIRSELKAQATYLNYGMYDVAQLLSCNMHYKTYTECGPEAFRYGMALADGPVYTLHEWLVALALHRSALDNAAPADVKLLIDSQLATQEYVRTEYVFKEYRSFLKTMREKGKINAMDLVQARSPAQMNKISNQPVLLKAHPESVVFNGNIVTGMYFLVKQEIETGFANKLLAVREVGGELPVEIMVNNTVRGYGTDMMEDYILAYAIIKVEKELANKGTNSTSLSVLAEVMSLPAIPKLRGFLQTVMDETHRKMVYNLTYCLEMLQDTPYIPVFLTMGTFPIGKNLPIAMTYIRPDYYELLILVLMIKLWIPQNMEDTHDEMNSNYPEQTIAKFHKAEVYRKLYPIDKLDELANESTETQRKHMPKIVRVWDYLTPDEQDELFMAYLIYITVKGKQIARDNILFMELHHGQEVTFIGLRYRKDNNAPDSRSSTIMKIMKIKDRMTIEQVLQHTL
ncbi:hypothetical protein SPFM14_00260 [Salmonella phage SPFM14]|nr:hypothetical protein SPFM14_00260 [Salmonella phage SPFM14]